MALREALWCLVLGEGNKAEFGGGTHQREGTEGALGFPAGTTALCSQLQVTPAFDWLTHLTPCICHFLTQKLPLFFAGRKCQIQQCTLHGPSLSESSLFCSPLFPDPLMAQRLDNQAQS